MKTYIYPENLRSTVKLWFWNVRDFCILCGGIIVAVALMLALHFGSSITGEDIADVEGEHYFETEGIYGQKETDS